ncbi:MAG: hypothetical protein K0S08_1623 [Gammaproteobacteria bacterium]|jgi:hypothetical protein|nr:hypothetical protein [Gammaproteobacteria bacterium]
MAKKIIYRVSFAAQNQVYELYALSVSESEMFGFIELEELLFGESSQLVIDPADEKLKNDFAGVKRTYIPLHNVLRIDTLEKEGTAKVYTLPGEHKSNVRVLPTGIMRKNDHTPKDE